MLTRWREPMLMPRRKAIRALLTPLAIAGSLTGVARFGPDTGSLEVHTYREGVAAKVGHDLIIEVESWEGSDEGGTLELTADPRSLRVREGHRGVKPLTDKDRDEIRKTIEAKVLGTQPIAFRSTLVADDAVEGELTI